MGRGLTDDELKALTDSEMRQSVGYQTGKLASARQKALIYYEGLAKGDLAPPEIEGRSSVVSTEVRNVIESILPELMAKFASSEKVVECEATKQADEEAAKTASDYLNYLFYKKNDGHKVLLTWFKDALMSKNGFVKVWWDNRKEETKEEYRGMDDAELALLMDDEEIEVINNKSYPDEEDAEQRKQAVEHLTQQLQQAMQAAQPRMPGQPPNPQAMQAVQGLQQQLAHIQQMPPKMLHDITCVRSKKGGKICIENVPPEECMISRKAKTIKEAAFFGHRIMRTASELKSMGYKNVDDITSDESGIQNNMEHIERVTFDDDMSYAVNNDAPSSDPSQRIIWITECYVRCDYDGDGIAELRKVVRAGNQILENEEVDVIPFVDITPIRMPHRFFGLSIADLAMEPQRIKTSILRAMLDNLYLQVNGRYFAVEGQVNLDDLLTSRPGGVVRVKQQGMVGRLDQSASDTSDAMGMLQYLQGFTEEATGWNRTANAQDNVDSLNTTATAANIHANRAQMRVDLIARNFAEGVVELFRMMLKLVCQYQNETEEVKLNGNWVNIDPREWRNQFGFNINVGLGTGSKEQQVQHLMQQLQAQHVGLPLGIVKPANIYASSIKLSEALGFKNADAFWTDPSKQPPQPPPPNPDMMKIQAQAQQSQQELQLKAQMAQQQAQQDMMLAKFTQEMQAQQVMQQNQLEAQRDALKLQHDAALQQQQQQAEIQLAEMKAQIAAASAERLAQINGEYGLMIAREKNQVDMNEIVTKAHVELAATQAENQRTAADQIAPVIDMVKQLHQKIDESNKMETHLVKKPDGTKYTVKRPPQGTQ